MSAATEMQDTVVGHQPKINEVAKNFLNDLEKERKRLTEDFPLCAILIDEAFDRVYATGRIPGREFHADVLKQKPIKITQRVFVPTKQYPKFNFIGKLLGPRGHSLKRLHESTQCKIMIKGRGSMRDKVKEEEFRNSDDPRYSHLNKDLYLEISTVAVPAECYARISYALAEIRKYIIPDKNDEISHGQLREIMEIDPKLAKAGYGAKPEFYKSVFDKNGDSEVEPEYFNVLKRAVQAVREDSEEYENSPISSVPRKRTSNDNEYEKVPMKRAVPFHTETQRTLDSPTNKPYNRIMHSSFILKRMEQLKNNNE